MTREMLSGLDALLLERAALASAAALAAWRAAPIGAPVGEAPVAGGGPATSRALPELLDWIEAVSAPLARRNAPA